MESLNERMSSHPDLCMSECEFFTKGRGSGPSN